MQNIMQWPPLITGWLVTGLCAGLLAREEQEEKEEEEEQVRLLH